MIFGIFVLFIALAISAIAAYYSIVGLAAIFAAAVMPIIIMASALEVAKIATTVWLHQNWHRCRFIMKSYLVIAVLVLMFITSLGIYGFLSKAHIEQSLTAGDNTVMIGEIDRRIEIERRRISDAETVIAQLDQAVQVLTDAQRIRGNDGAIAVRQNQASEREQLNAMIDEANMRIAELQLQRVPMLQEQLTIEAKVGPLKYIAALIYGADLTEDVLENAVRIVILLLVFVFDPLAIMMVLAGVESISWSRKKKLEAKEATIDAEKAKLEKDAQKWRDEIAYREEVDRLSAEQQKTNDELTNTLDTFVKNQEPLSEEFATALYDNLSDLYDEDLVGLPEVKNVPPMPSVKPPKVSNYVDLSVAFTPQFNDYTYFENKESPLEVVANTIELHPLDGGYVQVGNKKVHQRTLSTIFPDLKASANDQENTGVRFGIKFPPAATKGDFFLRVDYQPTKLFKFNGDKWIEVDKLKTDLYSFNAAYIQMLIDKIASGEYDPDLLTEAEKDRIEEHLRNNELGE